MHEPPTTQVIREGMVLHLNEIAQEGWKMVTVVKESGYYFSSGKETDGEAAMAKSYTFTTRHYPTNDLLVLDLQDHLDSMAKMGWELTSTQQLINEHSATTPQMMLFWGKDMER